MILLYSKNLFYKDFFLNSVCMLLSLIDLYIYIYIYINGNLEFLVFYSQNPPQMHLI